MFSNSSVTAERPDSVEVVVGRGPRAVRDLARRGVEVRREDMSAVAHPPGGEGEHPAQLAATEHPDHRAG